MRFENVTFFIKFFIRDAFYLLKSNSCIIKKRLEKRIIDINFSYLFISYHVSYLSFYIVKI